MKATVYLDRLSAFDRDLPEQIAVASSWIGLAEELGEAKTVLIKPTLPIRCSRRGSARVEFVAALVESFWQ